MSRYQLAPPPSAEADLPGRLREVTGDAHRRLEQGLDLLRLPLGRERFVVLLSRFWGFHAVWEPALRRHPELAALMAGRWRLDLLADDIEALGAPRAAQAMPLCAPAAALASSVERALGSLYVLEGSTLGGRIITRALQDAPWLPAAGLTYFDPYGPLTGARWRAMQAALKAASSPAADPLIEAGALDAFALLHDWLVEA